jgi:hypothetical protein
MGGENMSKRYVIFSTLLILLFTGCATMSNVFKRRQASAPGKALEVSPILKFDDVPVPSVFRILANESFAFQTKDVRVGLLKYEGKADPDEVVSFYREQMPLYNWKTVNIIEYGRRVLNFEKDSQSCVITLDVKGSKITLIIAISPRSKGAIPPATEEK